ncbi:hypothetical protein J6590_047960 [Homalodisca vitripennis]|nr:hypothetical protein J6590_047960 [Homalodisca vitripennis]
MARAHALVEATVSSIAVAERVKGGKEWISHYPVELKQLPAHVNCARANNWLNRSARACAVNQSASLDCDCAVAGDRKNAAYITKLTIHRARS